MAKILIVEDDKYLADAYKLKLIKIGFIVKMAMDGEEALNVLTSYEPDIILLDLILPKRDGFSVLEEIKKNPAWNKIPVIIVSNLGEKENIDLGMKLGAVDYIIKTNNSLDAIIEKIQHLVSKNS